MTFHDDETRATLERLMQEHGLAGDSRLYRATLPEHVTPGDQPDTFSLSANPDPSEAVVDVYGAGHMTTAADVGPGLAFAATPAHQWGGEGRVSVEIRLGDVLAQGGLVYPVESVITERVWYCTLPSGSVAARRVS